MLYLVIISILELRVNKQKTKKETFVMNRTKTFSQNSSIPFCRATFDHFHDACANSLFINTTINNNYMILLMALNHTHGGF